MLRQNRITACRSINRDMYARGKPVEVDSIMSIFAEERDVTQEEDEATVASAQTEFKDAANAEDVRRTEKEKAELDKKA